MMMRLAVIAGMGTLFCASCALAGGEIYGTIYTDRDREYTGAIRWDKNENFWDDILDSRKRDKVYVEHGGSTVRILGFEIGDKDGYWTTSDLKIAFGHVKVIEPRRGDRVRLELKSGERIMARATGTDLGHDMRGLLIIDERLGEVELEWGDVDRIEFTQGPGRGLDGERLYGTVATDGGDLTGYVVWDKDEALRGDILDGREDGRKRKIPFGEIRSIERRGSSGSRVTLLDGEELDLEDSNDVDDDNRGIDVIVPGLGVAEIDWDEFDHVTFADPPPSRSYSDFDGGRRLYGTVRDDHDRSHTGYIVWDLDEQYTWEYLDGEEKDINYGIPFENIQSINRHSRHAAEVVLKNGDVLILSGSNDVDRDNKGILVEMADGDEVELDWYDFESVQFQDP
jgi:hypothetical protein